MSAFRVGAVNGTSPETRYHEHYGLLWKLKATIEGLLAANTSNVWSMYGGLNRLGNQLDGILKHGLKGDLCPNEDYWHFIVGLRRLQPVLAPSIDQLSRRAEQEGRLKGLLWLHDSLENHTLSFQLRMLVADAIHLREFYFDDAFLCSAAHFAALDMLLQAVEQNNPRLLAQVAPSLLQKCPSMGVSGSSQGSPRLSRASSVSIERDTPAGPVVVNSGPHTLLFASPKGESVLDTMEAPAFGQRPAVRRSSAKDALKALLEGAAGHQTFSSMDTLVGPGERVPVNDPLLNRPVDTESFQRSRGLMRAESDTALLRSSSAIRANFDENENSFGIKKKGLDMNGESDCPKRRRRISTMYWEDEAEGDEGSRENSEQEICDKLVFTYDNSPSSSACGRTREASSEEHPLTTQTHDSSLLDPHVAPNDHRSESWLRTNNKQSEPGSRTNGDHSESGSRTKIGDQNGSRTSSRQSLLNASSEHLLFSEEEDDQIGFLAEQGRQFVPAHRHSKEDLNVDSPHSPPPPPVRQKFMRHSRSKSEQLFTAKGMVLEENHLRDSEPEGSAIPIKNGRRLQASTDDPLSSSLPTDTSSKRRPSDVGSDGYFPQPSQGESLFTFLSSQDFATCPEVDKENAHFCISEAIIAAVEQIKCHQLSREQRVGGAQWASPSDHESDGSDEEIQRLKQRIRLRRTEKREERRRGEEEHETGLGDSENGSPEDDDLSPLPDLSDSDDSAEEAEDFVVTESSLDTNLVAMKTGGLTSSLGSLYSDADLKRANKMHPVETVIPIGKMEPSSNQLSAESIALSLIKKFSFRQLPAASELEWLVSEKDAPQELLPLPKSVPISPDDGENADLYKNMRLRGNLEWAPPRPQIVFSIHPPPKRKQLIAKQNFRCAGCGMKVERGFLKRLRYCEYLGKYFCQCCHTNATSAIPSRILRKWDFSRYPVSNFSHELLARIRSDPVFDVSHINPVLYRKVKQMHIVKDLRLQLFYLKDFLKTCRLCDGLKQSFNRQPSHWMASPDLYSLNDLLQVRSGEMEKILGQHVEDGVNHVSQCQLCQAKGFVCELCNKDQIIFPFQLVSTHQCLECWACYHTACFQRESRCPKCERILARRGAKALKSEMSDEDPPNSPDS